MIGNKTFQCTEDFVKNIKDDNIQYNPSCSNQLPKAMEYVNHIKSLGGPHKMAFNMHIGWLKALGAPTYHTCQQMVNVGCHNQSLMCETYGYSRGCTMSSINPGETPCAFACTMEECQKCEAKATSGECTSNDCIGGGGGDGDGGGGDGGDGGDGDVKWSDVQLSDLKTHLTQTFPNMIDLKHMDLHDVSVDEVTQCATNMIVKSFPYETIINEDDEIYTNVTKKINSILYMCVISLSKGKTGDTTGDTNGSKSDGGDGNMKVPISIIIALSCLGLLLLAILLYYLYRLSL